MTGTQYLHNDWYSIFTQRLVPNIYPTTGTKYLQNNWF